MIEDYHLVGYDYSIFNDLVVMVLILCACMIGFSFWLKIQKRSWKFLAVSWTVFLGIIIFGAVCLVSTIQTQQFLWLGYFAKTAHSYAHVLMQFENWKIQAGQEKFFSDWSASATPQQVDSLIVPQTELSSVTITPPLLANEKLAVPKNLTVLLGNKTLAPKYSMTQIRRNQWGLAALTGDNQSFERSTKQIVVSWQIVPEATTYRLQWQNLQSIKPEWFDVYSGSAPSCILDIPDDIPVAFQVRAEDGTPEDDPLYLRLMDACDVPVTANIHIGYVYTLRPLDDEHLQFIVSPISDANHSSRIDLDERPTRIGELYEMSPFLRYVCQNRKEAITITPESDLWGNWYSIAEPLWTPNGEFDGVLRLDFHAEVLYDNLHRGKFFPYCFFIAVVVLFFSSIVFINRLHAIGKVQKQLAEKLQFTILELTEAELVAENASRSKTHFLANMSHELRTPLNAILGFSDILGRKLLQRCRLEEYAECQESFKQIVNNGNDLLVIINDILEFAAVDGEHDLKIEQVPVNLRALLQEIIEVMENRVENKPVRLTVVDNGSVPEYILSDPARIRQVLVNLIGNAIKFTEKGSIKIEYGTEMASSITLKDDYESVLALQTNTNKQMIYFSVSDTGIGIAPHDIEMIFRPFSQADASLTRRYGGTGIGLSVSKNVAELLGGHIAVSSTLGIGSTFTFTFQAWTTENESALKNVEIPKRHIEESVMDFSENISSQELPRKLSGRRILVVEDGKVNQLVITAQLKEVGAEVFIAENGQIGVEKVEAAKAAGMPFDAVLMDIQMPVMDGYEATIRLRNLGYTCPIIAITAHALIGDREKALNTGCNDYLPKPVNREKLITTILSFLK